VISCTRSTGPRTLDYRGKRVVVIGSGATAMTLVPAMAADAAEVVMLQRSPTYVIARPRTDRLANLLGRILLPALGLRGGALEEHAAAVLVFTRRTRRAPEQVRRLLLGRSEKAAGEAALGDFTPRYDPWDQRLCVVPDGDLFEALRSGAARVVTGLHRAPYGRAACA
jgi:monooxygenase